MRAGRERVAAGRPRYEFLDAVTSDLAFVARGRTLEELFAAAVEALLAATVADPRTVEARVRLAVELEDEGLELLLLRLLDELVFRRDADGLLLRAGSLRVVNDATARLEGELVGESIDRARHHLEAEVKAVTAHGLRVQRVAEGWEATVTVDV